MRAAAALLLALPPPSAAHFFGSAPGAAGADAAGPRRDYRQQPGVYGVDFKYYMKNNTVRGQEVGRGVTVRSWEGGGSSLDFAALAPAMTRVDFASGTRGASYPVAAGAASAFFLDDDAYFVVMFGNVSFALGPPSPPCGGGPDAAATPAAPVMHGAGDLLWVGAGQLIRPMVNAGAGPAAVQIMVPHWTPKWAEAAAACNPSSIAGQITHRSYLEREGCVRSQEPISCSAACPPLTPCAVTRAARTRKRRGGRTPPPTATPAWKTAASSTACFPPEPQRTARRTARPRSCG